MSATALQLSNPRLQPTTVPPGPGRPSRPHLRVLDGGRSPSRLAQQAVYRRRRLAVGLVVTLVVAAILLASAAAARIAGGAPSAAGGQSPTSAVASSAAGVAAPPTIVVQPGDTLWSIAAEVAPEADVRITVDQLVTLNGGSPIVVGQELALP